MKNYNIINLSIASALNHVQIGTSGGYIMLLEAPTSAKVFIHLNDSDADPIPLKAYHAIEASDIDKVFITCNAVANERIKLVQSKTSKSFRMSTPASDLKIEEISGFSYSAISQLKFIPNGEATQHQIIDSSFIEIDSTNLMAIKFHSSNEIGMELNGNGILFPINGTDEVFLRDIDNIKFHNIDIQNSNLKILYMGITEILTSYQDVVIDTNYIVSDYIVSDYYA